MTSELDPDAFLSVMTPSTVPDRIPEYEVQVEMDLREM